MELNVNQLARSGVILVLGLPLSLGVLQSINYSSQTSEVSKVTSQLKGELTKPCIRYMTSKNDSKLEREAKNEIDEVLGGEVVHVDTCKWVLG